MKLLTTIAIAAAATITTSQAFIVTAQGGDPATSLGVTDNAGNPIASGSGTVLVGTFLGPVPDFGTSTGQQIQDAFTAWGAAGTFGFNGFAALYQVVADGGRVGGGDAVLGASVWTLLGNGASIADSTELLAYQHGATFTDDSGTALPASITAPLSGGSFQYGGQNTGPTFVDPPGFNLPTVGLAPLVPEPSSSLLLGLGGLALLIRRKR